MSRSGYNSGFLSLDFLSGFFISMSTYYNGVLKIGVVEVLRAKIIFHDIATWTLRLIIFPECFLRLTN
jgi:hypothetical protein